MQLKFTRFEKLYIYLCLFIGFLTFFGFILPKMSSAQVACDASVNWRTEPSSDGKYKATAFGCSENFTDPNDNCEPGAGVPPEYCSGLGGPDCERKLKWFAANVGIFGKWKKVLVTREDTGKSVVVLTIDYGPACSREEAQGPLIDLSYDAATSLGPSGGNYETVTAKPVPDDTPLGPTDGSNIPSGSTVGGGGGSTSYTGCVITKVGNPTDPAPPLSADCNKGNGSGGGGGGLPGGPCQEAPPLPANVKQAIIDKWGITLDLPQDQIDLAWGEFYQIDCTGFLQDIKGTTIGSWGNAYAQQFSCPGDGGANIQFSNQWSGRFMQAIIVHEMTHVWQNCSSRGEQNKLDNDAAFESEGGLTQYSRTGCSFSVDLSKEDHADTIALYLNPDVGELTCGGGAPNPFSTGNYPKHQASAEKGVGKK
jgi:hypothetical protein